MLASNISSADKPPVYVTAELLEQLLKNTKKPVQQFFPARYIEPLQNYVPGLTGAAIAAPHTGEIIAAGDSRVAVSAQSTTKMFLAAMLMMRGGTNELFATVGGLPSDDAFNAATFMPGMRDEHKPRNPYINIGAMAVNRRFHEITGEGSADALLQMLQKLSGNKGIRINEEVASKEYETGANNIRLLGLVNNARSGRSDPEGHAYPLLNDDEVSKSAMDYFRQCAIELSPLDHVKVLHALMHKTNPDTGRPYLDQRQREILVDLNLTAGNYNQSGQISEKTTGRAAFKSGVGGTESGFLRLTQKNGEALFVPVCVTSGGLNTFGNPEAALKFIKELSRLNLAFKSGNSVRRALQSATHKMPNILAESSKKTDSVLRRLLPFEQQSFLNKLAVSSMDEKGREFIEGRSMPPFYLKWESDNKRNKPAYENALTLLIAPDVNGEMKTYKMHVGHNEGGHGANAATVGAVKIAVSSTPDAQPYRHTGGIRI